MKRRLAFVLAILLCASCFTGNLSLNVSAEEENGPVIVEQEQTAAESGDPEDDAPEEENTTQEENTVQEGNTSQEGDATQKDNSIQDAGPEPTAGTGQDIPVEREEQEESSDNLATPEESPQPGGEEETCTVRFGGGGRLADAGDPDRL